MLKKFIFLFLLFYGTSLLADTENIKITAECIASFKGADLSLSKDAVLLKQGRPGVLKKSFNIVSPESKQSASVSFALKILPYKIDDDFVLELKSSAIQTASGNPLTELPGKPHRRELSMNVQPGGSAVYEVYKIPELDCKIIIALKPQEDYGTSRPDINEIISPTRKNIEYLLEVYQVIDGQRVLLEKPLLKTFIKKPVSYEYNRTVPKLKANGKTAIMEEQISLTFLASEIYNSEVYLKVSTVGKMVYPLKGKKDFYICRTEKFQLSSASSQILEFYSDESKENGFYIEFSPYFN